MWLRGILSAGRLDAGGGGARVCPNLGTPWRRQCGHIAKTQDKISFSLQGWLGALAAAEPAAAFFGREGFREEPGFPGYGGDLCCSAEKEAARQSKQ
jgi:hypothetical protein